MPHNFFMRALTIQMGCKTQLLQSYVEIQHISKNTIQNNRMKTPYLSVKPTHQSLFSSPLWWRFHWNYGHHFSLFSRSVTDFGWERKKKMELKEELKRNSTDHGNSRSHSLQSSQWTTIHFRIFLSTFPSLFIQFKTQLTQLT
jgi:hypothetical protein